ncbi:Crp/Fnr family transcriptional regulator [Methylobacterium nigriterrae]|uniref:Crp/Fnr family transcriptional regulator n=1 Tax=Methylobacterium nigriterrae TaxID=3127512 RepID=UPI003013E0B3
MSNPLLLRLSDVARLSEDEQAALLRVIVGSKSVAARQELISARPFDVVHLVQTGIACRYKTLPSGTRRIVSYLVPGDLSDVHTSPLCPSDWRLCTLTACNVAEIPRSALQSLADDHPGIARALAWLTLTELSIAREWLVNDSRPAEKRVAHLFCELFARMEVVGQVRENSIDLGLSQVDLADTAGISFVHLNRVLQSLRASQLITFGRPILHVPDLARLQIFAEFDPAYLHLSRRRAGPTARSLQKTLTTEWSNRSAVAAVSVSAAV